jgi:hypothetical protein
MNITNYLKEEKGVFNPSKIFVSLKTIFQKSVEVYGGEHLALQNIALWLGEANKQTFQVLFHKEFLLIC